MANIAIDCYSYTKDGYYYSTVSDNGHDLPLNSTYVEPTLQDGYIPRWNGMSWSLVENHKGEEGYINGEPFEIKDYGPYPEGWSKELPPISFEGSKQNRKFEIDTKTEDIKRRDGLVFADLHFAMTEGAMTKWTGMLAAKDILQYPITILSMHDEPYDIPDQPTLLQFVAAALQYETSPNSPVSTGRVLRQQIEACTTQEELDLVVDTRE